MIDHVYEIFLGHGGGTPLPVAATCDPSNSHAAHPEPARSERTRLQGRGGSLKGENERVVNNDGPVMPVEWGLDVPLNPPGMAPVEFACCSLVPGEVPDDKVLVARYFRLLMI